jgi:hypothetical protein
MRISTHGRVVVENQRVTRIENFRVEEGNLADLMLWAVTTYGSEEQVAALWKMVTPSTLTFINNHCH